MKNVLLSVSLIALLFSCTSNSVPKTTTNQTAETVETTIQERFTLEDIFKKGKFQTYGVWGMNPMNDGKSFSKVEYGEFPSVVSYDLATGNKIKTLFSGENHQLKIENYSFNADETKMLLATNTEQIYRHSTKSNYYIYDIATDQLSKLAENGKQTYPTFSPDSKKIAYVQENNLYVKDLSTNHTTAITKNGKWNHIINGMGDWVYEEEFVLTRAFEWSPNSQQIAYFSFDESHVKEFSMDFYGKLYPEQYRFKYPKAGEENSILSTHIYTLATNHTIEVETNKNDDVYFPRMKWTPTNELVVFEMNRHQNQLELLKVNQANRSTTVLLKETNPYYVSEDVLDEMEFLQNGNFIWTSERDGYKHIYLYNQNGEFIRQLTKGNYDVTALYGVDETNGKVFFESAEETPLERAVYSINLDGSSKKKLTIDKGWNTASFSDNFDYFVHTYSNTETPTVIAVRDRNGNLVRTLEENQELKNTINSFDFPTPEFFQFTANNETLNGYMLKPTNFDATKQYPVLMFQYSGPGNQQVVNRWGLSNYAWHSYLTQKGYIIACIDGRGTGARGQEFKKATYQQLGKLEVEDQIAGAKYLGNLAYVNKDRIGIWGWSYGGYMSSLALFKGNDVFKSAIAVAPVTNWRYYDTIYTERYMRTPQENPNGYDDNSPINHVEKLKGNYLLVHGMADDNVHFQNAVDLITALNKAEKVYDLAIYPNKNHGIYGGNTRYQLYKKMTDFILNKL